LTAAALFYAGKDEAAEHLERAVGIAGPFGFRQLFISEGKDLLPLLWELKKKTEKPPAFYQFTGRLIDDICEKYNLKPAEGEVPKLSARQLTMLTYLSKGMTYSDIAEASGLGRGTVKSHILLMYKRLDVRSAQEAVIKSKMLGL
jgi:DNA-binding CsgD family transcriptional regulator